jgi:hypothetical protein
MQLVKEIEILGQKVNVTPLTIGEQIVFTKAIMDFDTCFLQTWDTWIQTRAPHIPLDCWDIYSVLIYLLETRIISDGGNLEGVIENNRFEFNSTIMVNNLKRKSRRYEEFITKGNDVEISYFIPTFHDIISGYTPIRSIKYYQQEIKFSRQEQHKLLNLPAKFAPLILGEYPNVWDLMEGSTNTHLLEKLYVIFEIEHLKDLINFIIGQDLLSTLDNIFVLIKNCHFTGEYLESLPLGDFNIHVQNYSNLLKAQNIHTQNSNTKEPTDETTAISPELWDNTPK